MSAASDSVGTVCVVLGYGIANEGQGKAPEMCSSLLRLQTSQDGSFLRHRWRPWPKRGLEGWHADNKMLRHGKFKVDKCKPSLLFLTDAQYVQYFASPKMYQQGLTIS